ncbi:MAG TPA: MBL fold metallo-hydrolase [Candidatus Limnocylindria bacterium]|nr:MBL fold metallo-hydrolase [Candidatus Limnocylindria bacterium]
MPLPGLTFLGHATVLIELGGLRILTDPILVDRLMFLTRVVRPLDPALYAAVDLVLISHLHLDHFDRLSLARLSTGPEIVTGPGGAGLAGSWGWGRVTELAPGASHQVGDVRITATPAAHPGSRPPFGPRGTAVGFLLESGPARLYFAGDTDLFPEMGSMIEGELDVALLPIGGWGPRLGSGHLDPARAAEAAARLGPRFAVPIHWGTLWPYGLGRVSTGRLEGPAAEFVRRIDERVGPGGARPLIARPGERVPFVP